MNKVGLKTCPFCGEIPKDYSITICRYNGVAELEVNCCGTFHFSGDGFLYKDNVPFKVGADALEKWSRRANE